MDVQLTVAAQTQADAGDHIATAIAHAVTLLSAEDRPGGAVLLKASERREHGYVDDVDDDDKEKADDEDVWLIPVGDIRVFFTEFDQDSGQLARLVLRAV